jgi:hypothetical protein
MWVKNLPKYHPFTSIFFIFVTVEKYLNFNEKKIDVKSTQNRLKIIHLLITIMSHVRYMECTNGIYMDDFHVIHKIIHSSTFGYVGRDTSYIKHEFLQVIVSIAIKPIPNSSKP